MKRAWLCCALLSLGFVVFGQTGAVAPQSATTTTSLTTQPVPEKANVTASQLTAEEMEHFLESARILGSKPIEVGVTHTMRLTLTDDRYTHDAHVQQLDMFRAIFRSKEGEERNFRDSYKFNIAAYRLSKMMGVGIVPPCVYRVVDGKPSAVDWWVDDVMFDELGRRKKEAEPPDLNDWSRQLNIVRDFDQLVGNEDRNQGNLLIDKRWHVWAIDHSRAFRDTEIPLDPKVLRRISNKMLVAMKALNQKTLEAQLLPWVTKEDIRTLLARRDWMVKYFESEVSTKGADAVITDLPRSTPEVTIQ